MARTQTFASFSLKETLARLGHFGWRFWPLWLAWVLVWALPPARDYARLVINGSQLRDNQEISIRTIWMEMVYSWQDANEPPDNPLPAASQYPADLDLALWEIVYIALWNNGTPSPDKLDQLAQKFPAQSVALSLPVQTQLGLRLQNQNYYYPPPPGAATSPATNARLVAKKLLSQARRGQSLEPDNAFWYLAEALAQWRSGHADAALLALERGAKCKTYDDKTLELARRVLAAHARYGHLSIEEKISVANRVRSLYAGELSGIVNFWVIHAQKMRVSNPALSLRWSAAIAGIGDRMQRVPNSPETKRMGASFQLWAWRSNKRRRKTDFDGSQAFALYATQNGRADIARETRVQAAARARVMSEELEPNSRNGNMDNSLALAPGVLGVGTLAQWISGSIVAGVIALCAGIYWVLWWNVANLFGWRARGAPSTRAGRAIPAIVITAVCLALAFTATALGMQFLAGPLPILVNAILISFAALAFFGAPFMLALWCALSTLRRHRAAFTIAPRVDTELRLSKFQRGFLRWFLLVGFASLLLVLFSSWVLWVVASWQGWSNVDLLAWLPTRGGRNEPLNWDMVNAPLPLIYAVFACVLCLPLWFWKWRWASPRALRPVTHGGLRRWKETLGALIASLGWLFLLVALLMWPLRARGEVALERALRTGEIGAVIVEP